MKTFKIIVSLALATAMALSVSSCGKFDGSSAVTSASAVQTTATAQNDYSYSRTADKVGFQLEKPQKGEEIAVLTIKGYGDIKIRLFPESAPKAVENFKELIKKGYYNGLIFHRVIKDFMIQGGDPTGTGTGGESIWGEGFEYEVNANLRHFKGALAMAHSSMPNSNGSQFYIVQGGAEGVSGVLQNTDPAKLTDEVKSLYQKNGGYPFLDFDYTVFGQTFEGLDIVDKIASVQTGENDKPATDVVIEKAELVKYEG